MDVMTRFTVTLTADELMRCPSVVVDHLLDFHDSQHAHTIGGRLIPPTIKVHARAMVSMDASWYCNHGAEAANCEQNMEAIDDAGFYSYRTTRLGRAGEELLLDYRTALPGVYAQLQAQRQRRAAG